MLFFLSWMEKKINIFGFKKRKSGLYVVDIIKISFLLFLYKYNNIILFELYGF